MTPLPDIGCKEPPFGMQSIFTMAARAALSSWSVERGGEEGVGTIGVCCVSCASVCVIEIVGLIGFFGDVVAVLFGLILNFFCLGGVDVAGDDVAEFEMVVAVVVVVCVCTTLAICAVGCGSCASICLPAD